MFMRGRTHREDASAGQPRPRTTVVRAAHCRTRTAAMSLAGLDRAPIRSLLQRKRVRRERLPVTAPGLALRAVQPPSTRLPSSPREPARAPERRAMRLFPESCDIVRLQADREAGSLSCQLPGCNVADPEALWVCLSVSSRSGVARAVLACAGSQGPRPPGARSGEAARRLTTLFGLMSAAEPAGAWMRCRAALCTRALPCLRSLTWYCADLAPRTTSRRLRTASPKAPGAFTPPRAPSIAATPAGSW